MSICAKCKCISGWKIIIQTVFIQFTPRVNWIYKSGICESVCFWCKFEQRLRASHWSKKSVWFRRIWQKATEPRPDLTVHFYSDCTLVYITGMFVCLFSNSKPHGYYSKTGVTRLPIGQKRVFGLGEGYSGVLQSKITYRIIWQSTVVYSDLLYYKVLYWNLQWSLYSRLIYRCKLGSTSCYKIDMKGNLLTVSEHVSEWFSRI